MTETIGKRLFLIFCLINIYKNRLICFLLIDKIKDFSQLPDNIKEYISKLQNDYQSLQTQFTNLTAVVDFADSTKIAEIADIKQRHQQELATINILMEGKMKIWNNN